MDAVLESAALAPSGGNVQPWKIVADDEALSFFLAREHTTEMDVGYRGSLVAIGAALHNARIAAAASGILGDVRLHGGTDPGRPVATMTFADGHDPDLARRYMHMRERTTNRNMGVPAGLDSALAACLVEDAEKEADGCAWSPSEQP